MSVEELHTYLVNDVAAFDFFEADLEPLGALADTKVVSHRQLDSFLAAGATADHVLTWDFEADWYASFPALQNVFTPAAGNDWVASDPKGVSRIVHGTFHGPIMVESLISALLFMNHQMPLMIRNFQARQWDRDLQQNSALLSAQTVLIVGLGHIGSICAQRLVPLFDRVIGVRRDISKSTGDSEGVEVYPMDQLDECLALADHTVLVLPGDESTNRFMHSGRLAAMKTGSYIYNFGRGNALVGEDLLPALQRLGGAFLDVTEEEPLPPDSPLWQHPGVFITPHSSCVYSDYKRLFIDEVIAHLAGRR